MLVVGVVAADLGAARCAVKAGLSVGAEGLFQPVQHGGVTGGFRGRLGGSTAIQGGEACGVDAVGQLLLPYGNGLHHGIFLLTDRYVLLPGGAGTTRFYPYSKGFAPKKPCLIVASE